MTKLEELINEFCPNGIEFKRIKDSYTRIKGTPITAAKMKEIASNDGEIKIFAGGKTVIKAHETDIPNANITRVPAVLVQSRGVIDAVYYDKPFTFKNEMWAYTADNPIKVKYLYYILKNNIEHFREAASGMGSLPQISLRVTEEFIIPIPPLPIQEEIVKILDNFTELTAELTARKQQYEYYANKIFELKNTEYKQLKNIAEIGTGSSNTNEEMENGKYPFFVRSPEVRTKDTYEFDETAIITSGDGVGVGKIFHYIEGKYALHQRAYRIHITSDDVIPKYYYHYMKTTFYDYIMKNAVNSSVTSIRRKMLDEYNVPVPPLEEQQHIVNILDRFDKLCNDISEGLPAEIEARQKQYEYYRDKLLKFKKKEAAEDE